MAEQFVQIPVELLGFIILLFVLIGGIFIAWITKLIAKWRYKPENDKSKLGEEQRRANLAAATANSHIANQGHIATIIPGKNSNSSGKTAKSRFRALFQRAR